MDSLAGAKLVKGDGSTVAADDALANKVLIICPHPPSPNMIRVKIPMKITFKQGQLGPIEIKPL